MHRKNVLGSWTYQLKNPLARKAKKAGGKKVSSSMLKKFIEKLLTDVIPISIVGGSMEKTSENATTIDAV